MLISIVICTYNRSDILKETLPSYLELKIPEGVRLEIIIVDNNSSDNTASFVKAFIEKNPSEIVCRYIFEPEQGLSYARNTGYLHSKGDYIVYTDDECIIPENWIEVSVQDINDRHPAFLGGPYYGKYLPGSTSTWYKESFGDSYILQYDLPNGPMKNRYLSGGNLFVRRDVFEKIGQFDVDLGMSGEKISYGEEVELQKRFIEKFPEEVIWYNPELFVWHCIRDEKMKLSFLLKDALIRGASSAELQKNAGNKIKQSPGLFIYFVGRAIISAVKKLFQSISSKDHFFTLLYQDYKSTMWRDIGGAWYRMKQLLGLKPK